MTVKYDESSFHWKEIVLDNCLIKSKGTNCVVSVVKFLTSSIVGKGSITKK